MSTECPGVKRQRRDGRITAQGLVFDALVYFPQLGDVQDLAERLADLPIVLNHLGGVVAADRHRADQEAAFAKWRSSILALATCQNVVVKIGGLVSPYDGYHWDAIPLDRRIERAITDWSPYISECIEAFGPRRCMFESNFPIDGRFLPYAAVWGVFDHISSSLTKSERAELFAGTAARTYDLDIPTTDGQAVERSAQ
jgi:L-fuconolactonase